MAHYTVQQIKRGDEPNTIVVVLKLVTRSDNLIFKLDDALTQLGGFGNWKDKIRDCGIVEAMIDSGHAVMEPHALENRYLLTGYNDGDVFCADIWWEEGRQPLLVHLYHESVWRKD